MSLGSTSTLSGIATGSPAAAAVLEKYRIDYYCAGNRLFSEVCNEKGLSAEELEAEIDGAVQASGETGINWNTAPLRDVIRHIVSSHHEFLKTELPRAGEQLKSVVQLHGSRDPKIFAALHKVFTGFARELELHMQKEEAILFPLIERYEAACTTRTDLPVLAFGTIEHPIGMMEAEHTSSDTDLHRIRELTHDFNPPEDAHEIVHSLFDNLRTIEADLHQHMHLENNILFPRAIALENRK